MDAPADPLVSTEALAATLGLPTFQLRLWLRAEGLTNRATSKRGVPLLAALAGILSALRQETATAKSCRPAPLPKPGDALGEQIASLSADLARITEGWAHGPVADEIEGILRRLPRHRRRAMREARQ